MGGPDVLRRVPAHTRGGGVRGPEGTLRGAQRKGQYTFRFMDHFHITKEGKGGGFLARQNLTSKVGGIHRG